MSFAFTQEVDEESLNRVILALSEVGEGNNDRLETRFIANRYHAQRGNHFLMDSRETG
jgi:hypothetical protein